MDHQHLIALVERYDSAAYRRRNVTLIASDHRIAPSAPNRLCIFNRRVDRRCLHPCRIHQQLFVSLRIESFGFECEAGASNRIHALDETREFHQ